MHMCMHIYQYLYMSIHIRKCDPGTRCSPSDGESTSMEACFDAPPPPADFGAILYI